MMRIKKLPWDIGKKGFLLILKESWKKVGLVSF